MADRRAAALVAIAIVAGTLSDRVPTPTVRIVGGYRVIAADFHVHTILLSPFDLVLEAPRRGLDAIAITPHNQIVSAQIGRWFSRLIGGPTILVGEEVRPPQYHLIAIGIDRTISWNQPAAAAIADVHRQGGVAIAAHPDREFWDGYDAAAMRALDGAETEHPTAFVHPQLRSEMQEFFRRGSFAAIGSSDYHGFVPLGTARTYVLATDNSEAAILDALRHHRTIVPDTPETSQPMSNWLVWTSRILGIIGLFAILKHD
jgi:hypothetical protein